MQTLIITIEPRSAFGGAIRGDTLFGQLCWAARHRWGEQRLQELLTGYTEGQPYLVVSDAMPSGYLPRPALPMHYYEDIPDADRKRVKKLRWLPVDMYDKPLSQWLHYTKTEHEIAEKGLAESCSQSHNTINRMTGTTGTGEFAPYTMEQVWFTEGQQLDLYIAHDVGHLVEEDVLLLIKDIGQSGYGRDASIGLGKFDVQNVDTQAWPQQDKANSWLTLAPCTPQGLNFDSGKCWYQPFTRFGRHGDMAVHTGKPFKTPLLMADTAALLTPAKYAMQSFTGQGIGGDGSLSRAISETVHQGYAPVLGVRMENEK